MMIKVTGFTVFMIASMCLLTIGIVIAYKKRKKKNYTTQKIRKNKSRQYGLVEKFKVSKQREKIYRQHKTLVDNLEMAPLVALIIGSKGEVRWSNKRARQIGGKLRSINIVNDKFVKLGSYDFQARIQKITGSKSEHLVYLSPIHDNKLLASSVINNQGSTCLGDCLITVFEKYNFIFQTSDIRVNLFEESDELDCDVSESKVKELFSSLLLATHLLIKDSKKVTTLDLILDRDNSRLSFSLFIHNLQMNDEHLHKKIEFRNKQTNLVEIFNNSKKIMSEHSSRIIVNTIKGRDKSKQGTMINFSFNDKGQKKIVLKQATL